jgi:hypothetical protein
VGKNEKVRVRVEARLGQARGRKGRANRKGKETRKVLYKLGPLTLFNPGATLLRMSINL